MGVITYLCPNAGAGLATNFGWLKRPLGMAVEADYMYGVFITILDSGIFWKENEFTVESVWGDRRSFTNSTWIWSYACFLILLIK